MENIKQSKNKYNYIKIIKNNRDASKELLKA
jgi:hypothetical protein